MKGNNVSVLVTCGVLCLFIILFGRGMRNSNYIDYPITNIRAYESEGIREPDTGYIKHVIIEYADQELKVSYSRVGDTNYIRVYDNGFYEVFFTKETRDKIKNNDIGK